MSATTAPSSELYAEVLLPLPLRAVFTYSVPEAMRSELRPGSRVVVPFGTKKFYTGIIQSLTATPPELSSVKEISVCLDSTPIVRRSQTELWDWISQYYLCAPGEVMKAALPAGLKLESETFVETAPDFDTDRLSILTERELEVYQQLSHADRRLSIAELARSTDRRSVNSIVSSLLDKEAVIISEKLIERYTPRRIRCVRVNYPRYDSEAHAKAFKSIRSGSKQEKALLALLALSQFMRPATELTEVTMEQLLEKSGVAATSVKELEKKGLVEIFRKEINRFSYDGTPTRPLPTLTPQQLQAFSEINQCWHSTPITLLHGVTSSGKTEIYLHLIAGALQAGRQALYLVPEIALTTQLTKRLQQVFGDKVVVYHSKFSDNERVDIYRRLLQRTDPVVIIGPRSAIFLPFASLGVVIVDEEHEPSYKQQDPAPRYNGRDAAMMLARMHGAKVLLGSATPSIETYYKAKQGRYGLVTLATRYADASLPDVQLIDTTAMHRQGLMQGALAQPVINRIKKSIADSAQSIVFLNRRGYAPIAVCKMCAHTPHCQNCDVALTYHKRIDRLVCHYCGAEYPLPRICPQCHEPAVEIFGYGTERIDLEVADSIPDAKIARMDLDTTRQKDAYQRIIADFSQGKANLLVGTQMVTKGLDFDRVDTVAILNSDALLHQPDFRAHERTFNMLSQVAGRAGRRGQQATVMIQTRDTSHPVLSHIVAHDYQSFYTEELTERQRYSYPPFSRIIYIYIKHRNVNALIDAARIYTQSLTELFGRRVFGPDEPPVSRVQLLYIRKIMLKIETNASMKKVKQILLDLHTRLHTTHTDQMRGTIVYYDIDPV